VDNQQHRCLCALKWLPGSACLAFALTSSPTFAQAPGATNPGVQLRQELFDMTPLTPNYDPGAPQQVPLDPPPDKPAAAPKAQKTLFFKSVRFQSNTAIPEDVLVQPFLSLIGEEVTFEQLQQAATQSEAIYKKEGYITTRVLIPAQDFNSGNIIIQAIEGFIQDVDVRGATPGLQAYVRKMLQPVSNPDDKQIFNFKKLERQLLLIRNFGGVTFNTSIAAGTELGGSSLIVDLNYDSFKAGIDTNNNISSSLGDWKISADTQYFAPMSQPLKFRIGGSYAFPYKNGLLSSFGSISSPIGNNGLQAEALLATSSTESKDLFKGEAKLQTFGESNFWSLGLSYPLVLERNSQLTMGFKGTVQNSSNDLYVDNVKTANLSTDKLRALRFNVDGYFASPNSTNALSFQLSQGLGGADDLASDEFRSNPEATGKFTSARLNLSRTQSIFDAGTLVTVKGAAQLSSAPLPSPEAFTYGGPQYGRAFNNVYLLGDQGWAFSTELAQPINFGLMNKTFTVTPFVWYDYGGTYYKEGLLSDQTVSTYGLGMRGNWLYNLTYELGWGIPSTNSFETSHTGPKNGLLYFNTGWRF
jgi:hemolysin activation/secretion protein